VKHVLVTGGSGYLGSMLVPALLGDGYKVTVIDNFMFRQTSLNYWCMNKNLTIIKGDVRDRRLMKKFVDVADIIIPLAALVGAPLCKANQEAAVSTNFGAIDHLASLVANTNKMVIIPISNSGYGIGEADKECTEDTPMRPISIYGVTKVDAENILWRLCPHNSIFLRLATVFGMSPRMRLDLLVNDMVYRAVNDRAVTLFEAHFKRNYIHVRDVVRAFLFGIDKFDQLKGQAYNVGLSDANLSKAELCQRIQVHLPNFVFHEAAVGEDIDKRDYIVSNAKIEAAGFRTAFSLDDGIEELVKGYQFLNNRIYGNV
jgi:nucleoside-diphosphate-sugar epimerase